MQILDGVKDGELVVVAANFLIDAESNLKAAVSGFGQAAPGTGTPTPAQAAVKSSGAGHQAQGTVKDLDSKAGTVRISHGAVASLQWPAMSMEFKLANDALRNRLQPGAEIAFEFVERAPGEWVITSVKPVAKASAAAAQHTGH